MNAGFFPRSNTKFIPPRVHTVQTASAISPNVDRYDVLQITGLAGSIRILNPSGTPYDFQKLIVAIKDNGTGQAVAWGSQYKPIGTTPSSVTTAGKFMLFGFIWRAFDRSWHCVASAVEA